MYKRDLIVLKKEIRKARQCPYGSSCAGCPAGTNADVLDGYTIAGYPRSVVVDKEKTIIHIGVEAINREDVMMRIVRELQDNVHISPIGIYTDNVPVPYDYAVLYDRRSKKMHEKPMEKMEALASMPISKTKKKE
jgi:hypothetical protein